MNTTSFSSVEQKSACDRLDLLAELQQVLNSLESNLAVEESKREDVLKVLADFECWDVYLALLRSFMKKASEDRRRDYTQRMVRVYFNFQEDAQKTSKLLAEVASQTKMPFNLFWRYNISEVMVHKDYKLEAEIIENITENLRGKRKDFLEKALERLLLLYEEKLYQEQKALRVYERLFEVNPKNQKALKFFKNFYIQKNQWTDVERCLKSLVSSCGAVEKHHYRIELATVYLHYLDETQKALDVLDAVDVSAGFEACKVKFSLLFLIGEFQKALEALRPLKALAESRRMKATIYYHVALTYQNLGSVDKALDNYENSLKKYLTVFVMRKYAQLALSYRKNNHVFSALRYLQRYLDQGDVSEEAKVEMRKQAKEVYAELMSVVGEVH